MAGMTKREAKNLALRFATIRPREPLERVTAVWGEMVEATSEHLPSNLAREFRQACINHGIWPRG